MAEYHLTAPLSDADVEQLNVGDVVFISGDAFTCRSRLHKYIFDEGHQFPLVPGERNVLIHVGPIMLRDGDKWHLVSFMPTSSIRFEKWGARSVDQWKLKMIIGKTTMGEETMEMMKQKKCVHVSPQSVSPCSWVDNIRVDDVDLFKELGTIEATWHMHLSELGPFVVDIDTKGNNLYTQREEIVNENRDAALEKLGIGKDFKYTKLY